jgi:hypothetical protein
LPAFSAQALQWAVDNGIKVTNNNYGSSGDSGTLRWRQTDEFRQ